jgi:hypothetical protein
VEPGVEAAILSGDSAESADEESGIADEGEDERRIGCRAVCCVR